MFFYWQIGAVSALRKHYNVNEMDFSGASAGALAATLAACHVDGRGAAEVALQLSKEAKLWDSYTGGSLAPAISSTCTTLYLVHV